MKSDDFFKYDQRAADLFDRAIGAIIRKYPQFGDDMGQCAPYQVEYMIPLMGWMLRDGRQWTVVDIGASFGTFAYMCHFAGYEVVATNPSQDTRLHLEYPFRMEKLNFLDSSEHGNLSLPGGQDVLYNCTEALEHNNQNPLPGLQAVFGNRPEWCFFSTGLEGTQGLPAAIHWSEMPAWDGEFEGAGHLAGWNLPLLVELIGELGYDPVVACGIDTCTAPDVPGARLSVLGSLRG